MLTNFVPMQQWWAKSNRDSIQSIFESQRRFDSNIARFDLNTYAIWYWFDSNFNDSIQETRDLNRNLEVIVETELNTHSHYSLLSQILSSNVWFYPSLMYACNNSLSVIIRGRLWTARSMHVKALLQKWKFQWLPLAGVVSPSWWTT